MQTKKVKKTNELNFFDFDAIRLGIASPEQIMAWSFGEVKKPGRRIWTRELGLLELLSQGEWLNEIHWQNVILIRGGVNNPKMYKIDIDSIMSGKHPNVLLKSGDIVYVPKDNISEYNVFVKKLLPTAQLFSLATSRFSSVRVLD